jgi:hypothetical protein
MSTSFNKPNIEYSTSAESKHLQYSNDLFKATSISTTIVPLNTLTAIPSYGFQNCTSLKNALITKNVKTINSYAFYGCTALSSIDYQAIDLTSIGNYAFYNCTSNRNIQVPDSVKSIGSYSFY